MSVTLIVLAATVVAALLLALRRQHGLRRQRAMAAVLDAADALEARLRAARAGRQVDDAGDHDPIRDALAEMLRQRLWLREHGQAADVTRLAAVAASIDAARARLDQQLVQMQRAGPVAADRATTR